MGRRTIWRRFVDARAAVFLCVFVQLLASRTIASAQPGTTVQCTQRPSISAAPPPAPPSPHLENAQGQQGNRASAVSIEPICPEGQIPVLPVAPRAGSELKGNPLIRPERAPAQPMRRRSESFLKFEEVYGSATRVRRPERAVCALYHGACFYYGSAAQRSAADGGGMTILIADPTYINPGAQGHSLDEIAIQGGPNDGNIVELGWIISTDQNGDSDPHIFVFHWVDQKEGCYNGCGWRQFSNKYYPGQNISRLTGQNVYVGYVSYHGNWWAWFDNEWIGYFPSSLWPNGYSKLALIQWFGEVATTNTADFPRIQMGTGILPPSEAAADMLNLCEVDSKQWQCNVRNKQALSRPTASTLYDIKLFGFGNTRYGGPGSTRPCTYKPGGVM
jgi:hypothetical protein